MPPRGTIYLDITPVSVVVKCRACGHWTAFAFTVAQAWQRAAAHEELVHPESRIARARASRHAD